MLLESIGHILPSTKRQPKDMNIPIIPGSRSVAELCLRRCFAVPYFVLPILERSSSNIRLPLCTENSSNFSGKMAARFNKLKILSSKSAKHQFEQSQIDPVLTRTLAIPPAKTNLQRPRIGVYFSNEGPDERLAHLDTLLQGIRQAQEISNDERVGIYLSYLGTLFTGWTTNIKKAVNSHGLELEEENLEDLVEKLDAEGIAQIAEIRETDDMRFHLIVGSMLILLMSKNLSDSNYDSWVRNRLRGLCARTIMGGREESISDVFPEWTICASLYAALSVQWRLRACIYYALKSSAQGPSMEAAVSSTLLLLLAWSEVTHLKVIFDQLITKRPETLTIAEFRGETGQLTAAILYMERLADNAPYVQFITDPTKPRPTEARHFRLLTAVAWEFDRRSQGKINAATYYQGVSIPANDPNYLSAINKIMAFDEYMMKGESAVLKSYFSKNTKKLIAERFGKISAEKNREARANKENDTDEDDDD